MRTPEAVAGMPCLVCKTALAMSERNGIEIDYCPTCRGVWLDRGELDKIIERAATHEPTPAPQPLAPPQTPPPGYGQQAPSPWDRPSHSSHGYDPRYGKKRKKSFLEEMFD